MLGRVKDSSNILDILGAIAATANDEVLSGSESSAILLAAALAQSEEGMYYPAGGAKALQQSLGRSIRDAGGVVCADVAISGIEFSAAGKDKRGWKAEGVKVEGLFGATEPNIVRAKQSVVSGLGALFTFTRLVPTSVVSPELRQQLSGLVEARPRLSVLIWLAGSREDLGLHGCDYFEFPARGDGPDVLPEDVEEFVDGWVKLWSPSAKDPKWSERQ